MANILNTVSLPISNTTAGSFLTSNGSNGTTWTATAPYTFTTTNTGSYQLGTNIQIKNDPSTLEVKGKIMHNGQDLDERLKTIETVLQIPTRDVTMEAKYPKLAKLYKQYMQELEKYKTFERLKGPNDD